MNYEKMWNNFRSELTYLKTAGVTSIDPVVALSFMQFMEQVEAAREGKDEREGVLVNDR